MASTPIAAYEPIPNKSAAAARTKITSGLVAKPSHLRGMVIGSVFFGLLCALMLGARLLAIAGKIQIPQ
jgi:hypothetical protein